MADSSRGDAGAGVSRRGFFGRMASIGVAAAAVRPASATTAGAPAAASQAGAAPRPGESVDVIEKVRLRGKPGFWNVEIRGGRVGKIAQAPIQGGRAIDGGGRVLTEGLVEHHIHYDKTLTEDRVSWDEKDLAADRAKWEKERAAGTFIRSFTIYRESMLKASFTEEDVFERAVRLAKMQSSYGATAVRSHAVVERVRGLNCVKGLLKAREAVRPFMDLQIALHPQDDHLLKAPHVVDLMRQSMKLGADGVGGLPELDWDRADAYIDLVFSLAKEYGGFVDMHTDQGGAARENKRMFSHPIVVAKTRKYGLEGRVTASHSYSLAYQPRERVLPVLDEMREVGVHLSCSANSFGEERVQIPRSRGVLVSLHNDNVRDTLNRGGNANLVEAAAIYYRQMGITSNEGLEGVFDLITKCPGKALGLKGYGLEEGGRADLVLWEADSVPHVLLHQARPAYVFKDGKVVVEAGRSLL